MKLEEILKIAMSEVRPAINTFIRRDKWRDEDCISALLINENTEFTLEDLQADDWWFLVLPQQSTNKSCDCHKLGNTNGVFPEKMSFGVPYDSIVTLKGTFSWALECMKTGIKVKRGFWSSDTYVKFSNDIFTNHYLVANSYQCSPFTFNKEDILATDWEVFDINKM